MKKKNFNYKEQLKTKILSKIYITQHFKEYHKKNKNK